jgi:hypothetical protein
MASTTLIAGALIAALGFLLKGALAKVVIYIGVWVAKKGVGLWFLQTPWGRRLVRAIRFNLYTRFGRGFGRKAFWTACRAEQAYAAVEGRLRGIRYMWKSPI